MRAFVWLVQPCDLYYTTAAYIFGQVCQTADEETRFICCVVVECPSFRLRVGLYIWILGGPDLF